MKDILSFTYIEFLRNTVKNIKYLIFGVGVTAAFLGYFVAWIFSQSEDGTFIGNKHYMSYLLFIAMSAAFLGILKGIYDIYVDRELMHKFARSGLALHKLFIAKFIIAFVIGIIQCFLLTLPALFILKIQQSQSVIIYANWVICLGIFICSYALALIVSCVVGSDKIASISIALLLVPQIMLSGQVPYKNLHKAVFLWESNYAKMPPPAVLMPVPVGFEALVVANYTTLVDEFGNSSNVNNDISGEIAKEADNITLKNGVFRSAKWHANLSMWVVDLLLLMLWCAGYLILAYVLFMVLNSPKFKKSNLKFQRR
ncbi:ABC transporter permease [Campylobacter sp. VBCF_06 NA8]|uniref:ABC transporter permease n=1 Tax=Campylobacter sp. VBCF_06 NA8 TaxID=2983822 RepID=UPI0022EA041E|nr:ABC transporter permease [Campylobacter sp. VBCF_06 NA8]MDA3046195.1 ABC transporter permease [Campylobacter sp. VBCF_06 NA8]